MIKILKFLTVFLVLVSSGAALSADTTRILTGFPAGSGPDNLARHLAAALEKKWGTPVVVDNRPGASGSIAMRELTVSPHNGTVLFLGSTDYFVTYPLLHTNQYSQYLYPLVPYAKLDMMLVASPKFKNFNELSSRIDTSPIFGSWGIGSIMHFAGESTATTLSKQPAIHVLYKDFAPLFSDVVNQQVTYVWAATGTVAEYEKGGLVKFFAVSTRARNPNYPSVPSITEISTVQLELPSAWIGIGVHSATDPVIKLKLEKDVADTIATLQNDINDIGYLPWPVLPDEFRRTVKNDSVTVQKIINKYSISIK